MITKICLTYFFKDKANFQLNYYPHYVNSFTKLLKDEFTNLHSYKLLYDYSEIINNDTGFFQHVLVRN